MSDYTLPRQTRHPELRVLISDIGRLIFGPAGRPDMAGVQLCGQFEFKYPASVIPLNFEQGISFPERREVSADSGYRPGFKVHRVTDRLMLGDVDLSKISHAWQGGGGG